jgi:hypothetical protein
MRVASGRSCGFAAQLWDSGRIYLADPQRVLQVRDAALVLGGGAISVMRRGDGEMAVRDLDPRQVTRLGG